MDANTAIWGCQVKYRLGLDIGTASVGLVALELDGEGRPVKPVHHSVRIFDEPLLPPKSGGVGKTKKSGRRVHRQQRKLHMRRARRLQRIAQLAPLMGLDPKTIPADKGQRVHKLRAQAAAVEIPLEDLLLVFLKMAKRRGYHGGFKVKKSGDAGMVEPGIGKLKAEMNNAGCGTLGEYLLHRIQNGQHLRFKEEGLFAHRDMVEEEFNRIWDVQKAHHERLRDEDLRKNFHKVIVLQRPLKSPAHMVGNCSLEPMLPRAPMAQPIVQAFRIEKQLADLRWGASSRAEPLSPEQKIGTRWMPDIKSALLTSSPTWARRMRSMIRNGPKNWWGPRRGPTKRRAKSSLRLSVSSTRWWKPANSTVFPKWSSMAAGRITPSRR